MKKVLLIFFIILIFSGCGLNKTVETSKIITETTAPVITPSIAPTIEPTPTPAAAPVITKAPESTPESAKTKEEEPKPAKKEGDTVYIGKSGNKYHDEDCPSLKGKGAPIKYEEAVKQGREPCKICQ